MFIQVTGVTYKSEEHQKWSEELNATVTYSKVTSEIDEIFKAVIAINQIEHIEEMEDGSIIYFNSGRVLNVKESIKKINLLLLTGNICHFN